MNLSPRWQSILESAGIDAIHWSKIGEFDAADSELAAHALSSGAMVLTQDLDFGALLAASGDAGPSVIQIRSGDTSPERIGNQVLFVIRQFSEELSTGALVTIDIDRSRVRTLPIRRSDS